MFLLRYTETITEYQLRRLSHVCSELISLGEPLRKWVILRKAGLSKERLTRCQKCFKWTCVVLVEVPRQLLLKKWVKMLRLCILRFFFDTTTIKTPVGFVDLVQSHSKIKSRLFINLPALSRGKYINSSIAATVGQIQLSPPSWLSTYRNNTSRFSRVKSIWLCKEHRWSSKCVSIKH